MRSKSFSSWSGVQGWLLFAVGCGELLGIETAHVDPSLTPAVGEGGTGGASSAVGGTASSHGGQSVATVGGQAGAPGASDLCVTYCEAVTRYCRAEYEQYVDLEQCLRICAILPQGSITEPDGNSVTCRLKYAQKAEYESGKELAGDCPAAGPGGGGICGAKCEGFCTMMMATCRRETTDPYFYASYAECERACSGLPEVPYNTAVATLTTGDYTLQCRLFHLTSAAMLDPEEHCGHALGITLCEPR